jgi:hypothetical protein
VGRLRRARPDAATRRDAWLGWSRTVIRRHAMVARAAHSITIARPREQVFDYIADARHQRRWNPVCKAMEQTTPGPIGVGTRFRGTFQGGGEMNVEITEYERVGCENSVTAGIVGHAARSYSWMRPPSRSRLRAAVSARRRCGSGVCLAAAVRVRCGAGNARGVCRFVAAGAEAGRVS